MGAVLAIARMISEYPFAGCAALWRHRRYYLLSSKTPVDKPETFQKQDTEITGKDEDIHNDESRVRICRGHERQGLMFNSNSFDALEWRRTILDNIMEALGDPNTHIIGVYGSNDEIKNTLLQRVRRRVDRDKLFDVVLTATVKRKPNVRMIQEEIADQLGFKFNEKSEGKRASELLDRIKNIQKILIILWDLYKKLDLDKVGIPFVADHKCCKMLVFSTSEEVLSNQMHTQKNFMV